MNQINRTIPQETSASFWPGAEKHPGRVSSAFRATPIANATFKHGKMSHFIWMGLLFGLVFVLTLVGVVQLVLHFTGN